MPGAATAVAAIVGSLIGLLAGAYTVYGGLRAVVWSDLIQGAGLVLGRLDTWLQPFLEHDLAAAAQSGLVGWAGRIVRFEHLM